MKAPTLSLTEVNDYYTKSLAKYKTPAGKKAALTRDIKAQADHYERIKRAQKSKAPYYLGDRIFSIDVFRAKRELDFLIKLRSEL
jgi:hypothetical protein